MSKRLGILSLFFAWLCASGALLDTTQVFAWARMFAGYTRTMSVEKAAFQTLDPGKPCAICLAVSRAREAGRRQQPVAAPTLLAKILLAHVQNEPFILPPNQPEWSETNPVLIPSWLTSVPVPPPRTQVQEWVG